MFFFNYFKRKLFAIDLILMEHTNDGNSGIIPSVYILLLCSYKMFGCNRPHVAGRENQPFDREPQTGNLGCVCNKIGLYNEILKMLWARLNFKGFMQSSLSYWSSSVLYLVSPEPVLGTLNFANCHVRKESQATLEPVKDTWTTSGHSGAGQYKNLEDTN